MTPTRTPVAVLLLVAAAVAGILTHDHLRGLTDLARSDPDAAQRRLAPWLWSLTVVLPLSLLLLAAWLVRLCLRTLASGRFPPPGYAVVRATEELTGARAVLRARIGFVLAGIFAALAGMAFAVLWRMLALLAVAR